MTTTFNLPNQEILNVMAPVYAGRGVAMTWKRFIGTTEVAGKNVDGYAVISITALKGDAKQSSNKAAGSVDIQGATDVIHFRAQDLPTGVTARDLTQNDIVIEGARKYAVLSVTGGSLFVRAVLKGN